MTDNKFRFGNPLCPLPFIQQFIDTDKSVRVCCHSDDKESISNDLSFNSIEYEKIRDSMLEGNWPSHCQVCKNKESNKTISPRQRYLSKFKNVIDEPIDRHRKGLELSPLNYDLRFSNLCNLTCQTCDAAHSSSIAKKLNIADKIILNDLDIKINPEVSYVYLAGGEPFLIKKFSDFLKKIENKDCEIVVNTNGTIITSHLLNELIKFKNVNITLSLDGFGQLNDKIREGSKWDDIITNLALFKGYNFSIHVNTVLQKDNINQLLELGKFLEKEEIVKWTLVELTDPPEFHWKNEIVDKEKIKSLMNIDLIKENVETIFLLNKIIT